MSLDFLFCKLDESVPITALKVSWVLKKGKLEKELVDKPGTTIGTKFSVLQCIRKTFLMRCGF